MFPEDLKKAGNGGNLKKIDEIWRKVDSGKITVEEAREEIASVSNKIDENSLSRGQFPYNNQVTETYDRSNVKLYDDIKQPEPDPVLAIEAAPDPNDAVAVTQWAQLTDIEKLSITQEVVPWIVNRVVTETKTHIDEPSLLRGGYEGTPNYPMAVAVEVRLTSFT